MMHPTTYLLRAKSRGWKDGRLLKFNLTVEYRGKQLGGNNIQAVVGAPDKRRFGLDQDVAMWLSSGWWVTLRNHFARAPDVALPILASIDIPLSAVTAAASDARGASTDELTRDLFATIFEATGPDYWA